MWHKNDPLMNGCNILELSWKNTSHIGLAPSRTTWPKTLVKRIVPNEQNEQTLKQDVGHHHGWKTLYGGRNMLDLFKMCWAPLLWPCLPDKTMRPATNYIIVWKFLYEQNADHVAATLCLLEGILKLPLATCGSDLEKKTRYSNDSLTFAR